MERVKLSSKQRDLIKNIVAYHVFNHYGGIGHVDKFGQGDRRAWEGSDIEQRGILSSIVTDIQKLLNQ